VTLDDLVLSTHTEEDAMAQDDTLEGYRRRKATISIRLDPARLAARGLTPRLVRAQLRRSRCDVLPTTDALDLRVRVPGWTGWIDEGNGWRRRHKGATVPSMVDGHGAPLVDMWALGTQYRVTWP
jgi:hypothetical protein